MDYTELTPDQQYQIVQGRIRQYEQSHLLATLDLAAANAAGETSQAEGLTSQVTKWEEAASAARAILTTMPQPDATTQPPRRERRNAIRSVAVEPTNR